MTTHHCKRCGSAAVVRERDADGNGTLDKCVACGSEDYSTYRPARELPKFASKTTLMGYHEARAQQVVDLFMDGFSVTEIANRTGKSCRQVYRYWQAYIEAQRALAGVA